MTTQARANAGLVTLIGDGLPVSCIDGHDRRYLNLDAAASTSALSVVARAVEDGSPRLARLAAG
jgi:hypothetical protein